MQILSNPSSQTNKEQFHPHHHVITCFFLGQNRTIPGLSNDAKKEIEAQKAYRASGIIQRIHGVYDIVTLARARVPIVKFVHQSAINKGIVIELL